MAGRCRGRDESPDRARRPGERLLVLDGLEADAGLVLGYRFVLHREVLIAENGPLEGFHMAVAKEKIRLVLRVALFKRRATAEERRHVVNIQVRIGIGLLA